MYRERIPTAPKSIGRQAPAIFSSGRNFGFLAPVGRFVKTAVESLDPRFIASEGGRSVQHVVGDATELGRSIITGEDTLSESPTARAYQAAGGGAPGVLAAALPYVNVGTAVLPTTRVLTPAGRAAIGADAAERLAQKQILATEVTPGIRPRISPATQPPSRSGMFSLGAGRENVMIYQLGDQGQVQGALEMYPTPEGYVVQNLSAELGSPTVARLLAGAKLRAQAQYPGLEYPLAPSTNLSQYSRPLVEKLQAAGLVDPNFGLPAIDEINAIDLPYHAANPIDINDVPRLVPIQKQELQQTTKELIRALAQAKREGRINPDSVTRTTELRSQLAERQRQAAEDFFAPPAETMAQRSARLAEMQRQNTMRELAQFGDQLAEGSFPSGTAQLPSLVRTPAAWMPVLDDPYRQVMAMYEQGQIYNIEMLDDALAQAIPTFVQQYAPTAAGFTPVEQQVIGQQLWRMAPDFLTNVSTGWKTGELGQSLAEWRNSPRYRRPQSKY
jgi:hypothetical protein